MPEARIAIGHGQMSEDALEQVMVGFWEKELRRARLHDDRRVRPRHPQRQHPDRRRAPTRFGLSQLHQIRGRVGRGRERAYAYFTYPPEKPLTETAHDRLATIAQNTEIGAGMAVAMKDLEIRGAGNLLGGEQSGHIASVGFDLYMRLVGEAVGDFKRGGCREEEPDPRHQGRPAGRRAPAARLRPRRAAAARGLPPARRRRTTTPPSPRCARSWSTATARCPTRSSTCSPSRRSACVARRYGLTEVTLQGNQVRFAPLQLRESQVMRLQRLFPRLDRQAETVDTVLVPRPMTARIGGQPLRDVELLDWCRRAARRRPRRQRRLPPRPRLSSTHPPHARPGILGRCHPVRARGPRS